MTDEEMQEICDNIYDTVISVSGSIVLGDLVEVEDLEDKMFSWFDQLIVQHMRDYCVDRGYLIQYRRDRDEGIRVDRLYPENPENSEGGFTTIKPCNLPEPYVDYGEGDFVARVAADYIENRVGQIYEIVRRGEKRV